jgi:hypothetical protein
MCIIQNVKGSLFEFGPTNCDGMAIWFCGGGSLPLHWTKWLDRLDETGCTVQRFRYGEWTDELTEFTDNPRADVGGGLPPHAPPVPRLFRVTPRRPNPRSKRSSDEFRLRYFYIFGNPGNARGAPTASLTDDMRSPGDARFLWM